MKNLIFAFGLILYSQIIFAQADVVLSGSCFPGSQVLPYVTDIGGKPAYQIDPGSYGGASTSLEVQWDAGSMVWLVTAGGGAALYSNSTNSALPPSDGWTEVAVFGSCASPSTVSLSGGVFLPVELISFSARMEQSTVQLKWSTASELNNEYFQIEKSNDGDSFKEIGIIEGNGTTTVPQQYSFLDRDLNSSITYYRLKQVDFDGKYEYSNIVSLDRKNQSTNKLKVFPNPFSKSITLNNASGNIALYDLAGRLIKSLPIGDEQGSSISYNLEDLEAGIYMLEMTSPLGERSFKKIIKQ